MRQKKMNKKAIQVSYEMIVLVLVLVLATVIAYTSARYGKALFAGGGEKQSTFDTLVYYITKMNAEPHIFSTATTIISLEGEGYPIIVAFNDYADTVPFEPDPEKPDYPKRQILRPAQCPNNKSCICYAPSIPTGTRDVKITLENAICHAFEPSIIFYGSKEEAGHWLALNPVGILPIEKYLGWRDQSRYENLIFAYHLNNFAKNWGTHQVYIEKYRDDKKGKTYFFIAKATDETSERCRTISKNLSLPQELIDAC